MKYLKNIHEHLCNINDVSKKLQKFFGVFVVALFLMSNSLSASTANTKEEKVPTCSEMVAMLVDAIESHPDLGGCMSAEEANEQYNILYEAMCN